MPYSWITLTQAKAALASRLQNPSFWIDAELEVYLIESLRTFNSIANFYRDRTIFNTQSGFAFYDLTKTVNPDTITAGTGIAAINPPNFLGYSVTDRNLINTIEYNLIEPITVAWAGAWLGTEQFTMNDIVRALERRRNQFLAMILSHLTHSQVFVPIGNGRVSLSDSIIDIHRVAWKTFDGVYIPLYKVDEQDANTLFRGYENNPGTPQAYSILTSSPIGIRLIPTPIDIGTLDIISINTPTNLDETVGVLLNIPDDLSWIIRFGALADLLGLDSKAYDPVRAQYCEQRYQEGIQIALAGQVINQVAINGQYILPEDLVDFDLMQYNWQNISGIPTSMAVVNRNLLALYPVPDDSYSIQLDVLRNMPIPVLGGDFLQVGREHFDLILDYAVHLAMFKCAGTEFESTFYLLNNFMQKAMMNNARLMEQARNYDILSSISKKEEVDNPRFSLEG